jgi:tRNA(Ile)-lysidine synthase
MGGKSIKLSDFMINLKIPQRARDGWPLVCLGDEIIWVPGFRQADPFCLTQETRQVVRLSLKRK